MQTVGVYGDRTIGRRTGLAVGIGYDSYLPDQVTVIDRETGIVIHTHTPHLAGNERTLLEMGYIPTIGERP